MEPSSNMFRVVPGSEWPTQPILIMDGYGLIFDPIRYWALLQVGMKSVEISTYTDPCGTGYIPPDVPLKELPAGHYEKGSGV